MKQKRRTFKLWAYLREKSTLVVRFWNICAYKIQSWQYRFHKWKRALKPTTLAFAHDVLMMAIACLATLALLRGEDLALISPLLIIRYASVYMLIAVAVFIWVGPYRHVWRYASFNDITRIILSVIYTNVIFLPLQVKLLALPKYSLSIFTLTIVMSFTLISLPRLFYLILSKKPWKHWEYPRRTSGTLRALLIGATDQTELFIRHARSQDRKIYDILGIIDDNKHKIGQFIHGVEVLGHFNDIPKVLNQQQRKHKPLDVLIIADLNLYGPAVRPIAQMIEGFDVEVLRLADFHEMTKSLTAGAFPRNHWSELLPKSNLAAFDKTKARKMITGKRILVVGAQAPFAQILSQEIANLGPAHFSLVADNEMALSAIERHMMQQHPFLSRRYILGGLHTKSAANNLFNEERPDYVLICPLTHSPSIAEISPAACLERTLTSFINLVDALEKHPLTGTLLISSTYVNHPESVMGLILKLLEDIFILFCEDKLHPETQKLGIIRFPSLFHHPETVLNVAQGYIQAQKNVVLPSPDMLRYFLSDQEAAETVLMLMADLHIHDLGVYYPHITKPVSVTQIIYQMIQKAGFRPDFDIGIEFSKQKIGEPIYEKLAPEDRKPVPSLFQGLIKLPFDAIKREKFLKFLQNLIKAAKSLDDFEVQKLLNQLTLLH